MRYFWVVVSVLLANSALAQEVRDCRAFNYGVIINPLDLNGRSYANGEVTIAVVHDGGSSSTDSLFILVYAPDPEDPDQKQCQVIGKEDGRGFAFVRLESALSEYTAAEGLTVTIPARIYSVKDGSDSTAVVLVNVSRATHEITVTQELGTE